MHALRVLFLALAFAVLGLVGWRSVAPRPGTLEGPRRETAAPQRPPARAPAPPPRLTPERPSPEDRVAQAPEFAAFYGRLRAEFPREYSAMLGRLGGSASPDAAIWDALRDLQQSRGVLAAQADADALTRFFDARAAVVAELAPSNARRCVDFLYGMTDPSIAGFTADHRGLVATLAERTLDAIADGRARPAERAAPTPADLDTLTRGLAARGLAPAEVGLLLDGTTPDPPLPDRRVCEIGRTYLDALRELPADARQRVYGLAAELLARS